MKIISFFTRIVKTELLGLYLLFSKYILFLFLIIIFPLNLNSGPVSNKEITISIQEEFLEDISKIINSYGLSHGGKAKRIIQNYTKNNFKVLETSPVDIVISKDIQLINFLEENGLIKKKKILTYTKNNINKNKNQIYYYVSIMTNAPNPNEASLFFSFLKKQ